MKRIRRIAVVVIFFARFATPSADLSADDAIFDVSALIATPLNSRVLKSSEHDGIVTEEVRFHSERDGEKDVDIFAFFSYPKGARQLPAYIWNPGGLGQASPAYTQKGAQRGYATLCIDFPQPGYRSTGEYPINAGLTLGDDPRQAPIYHGAVALLKAVSYLESRPEVDKDRIGMAGSSWGGFFTTLMIGIDPRLKVGACQYGCGSLHLGNAWWDGDSRNPSTPVPLEERERWRTILDPAWRLPTKKTPIGWFTGTNDRFYSLAAVMKSYEMAADQRFLMFVPNWDHALPAVLGDEMFLAWLDVHLQKKYLLPVVMPISIRNEAGHLIARWNFEGEGVSADLIASYGGPGNWSARFWHTLPAQIDGRTCRAELPAGTLPCYISGSVTNNNGLRSSTPLLRVESTALGVRATVPVPDYDGCREWGGFEEPHIAFLERHNRSGQQRWLPRLSRDAREGMHSAILEPGLTVLPPILSTATVPHRLTCFMKSEKPVTIALQLAGEQKMFDVGTTWTAIRLDHTPPNTLMGGIGASITAPAGSTVLVDAISFHPLVAP